jgi:hypothetical protein
MSLSLALTGDASDGGSFEALRQHNKSQLVGMEITTATMAVDSEVKGWHSIIVKVFCRFLSTLDT